MRKQPSFSALSRAPKTLVASKRGRQHQSMDPCFPTSATVCRFPMSPYSSMGKYPVDRRVAPAVCTRCMNCLPSPRYTLVGMRHTICRERSTCVLPPRWGEHPGSHTDRSDQVQAAHERDRRRLQLPFRSRRFWPAPVRLFERRRSCALGLLKEVDPRFNMVGKLRSCLLLRDAFRFHVNQRLPETRAPHGQTR